MRLLLALVLTVSVPPSVVDGHADLIYPPARNVNPAKNLDMAYCPHCGQSGGTQLVAQRIISTGGSFPSPYPDINAEGTHGLCGDPFQSLAQANGYLAPIREQPFMEPGEIQATWVEGNVIELRVGISTNHKGFFEFRICDKVIDKNTPDQVTGQACLDKHLLQRVDPKDRRECDGADISLTPDCQPLDTNYPSRWYLPPQPLAETSDPPQYPFQPFFRMKYRLPAGLTCQKCTMQWWWLTANSCHPAGERYYYQSILPSAVNPWAFPMDMRDCSLSSQTEQFWNCADIRITPFDGSFPPSTTPAPPGDPPVQDDTEGSNNDDNNDDNAPPSDPPVRDDNEGSNSDNNDNNDDGYVDQSKCTLPKWYNFCEKVDDNCCMEGTQCYRKDKYYAQCRPRCPRSWDCSVVGYVPPPPPPKDPPEGCSQVEPLGIYEECTNEHSGCCGDGLLCYKVHDWYSQCRPAGSCPECAWDCTPVAPPCDNPVGKYGNCRDNHCCESGLVCYEQDDGYAQCMEPLTCPECETWTCTVLLPGGLPAGRRSALQQSSAEKASVDGMAAWIADEEGISDMVYGAAAGSFMSLGVLALVVVGTSFTLRDRHTSRAPPRWQASAPPPSRAQQTMVGVAAPASLE